MRPPQLYDTVREIQSKVQKKLQRAHDCVIIAEESGYGEAQGVEEVCICLRLSVSVSLCMTLSRAGARRGRREGGAGRV